jgi:hypothetical protein
MLRDPAFGTLRLATGCGLEGGILFQGDEVFSPSPQHPDFSGTSPDYYLMGTEGYLLWGKVAVA